MKKRGSFGMDMHAAVRGMLPDSGALISNVANSINWRSTEFAIIGVVPSTFHEAARRLSFNGIF